MLGFDAQRQSVEVRRRVGYLLADLVEVLDPLHYLSPFYYADTKRVLLEGVVPWHLAVLLGAFVLLTALAMRAFEGREIAAGRWQPRALMGGAV